jgi:stearoyl-CoA desaturase (Delta-9 desaturase)
LTLAVHFVPLAALYTGLTAAQKGALWWAAHHRHHHQHSDTSEDIHAPLLGRFWSHVGWIMCTKYDATDYAAVKDFAKSPELRFLDRYHLLPPVALGVGVLLVGGWSAPVIGFFLCTVRTYHGVFFINSLTHWFGRRRHVTTDTSRNSLLLARVTLGEGWHNKHHHYQSMRTPPKRVLAGNRLRDGHVDIGMFEANWANATASLENARDGASAYDEARKRAVDALVASTREATRRITKMTIKAPADS